MYHQMMICVSDEGHSERIQGSQQAARECNYLKPSKARRDDKDGEKKEKEKDRSTKGPLPKKNQRGKERLAPHPNQRIRKAEVWDAC